MTEATFGCRSSVGYGETTVARSGLVARSAAAVAGSYVMRSQGAAVLAELARSVDRPGVGHRAFVELRNSTGRRRRDGANGAGNRTRERQLVRRRADRGALSRVEHGMRRFRRLRFDAFASAG